MQRRQLRPQVLPRLLKVKLGDEAGWGARVLIGIAIPSIKPYNRVLQTVSPASVAKLIARPIS
jgi:hypothetical protein